MMHRVLAALWLRVDPPCDGCGQRNLWSTAHGPWCFMLAWLKRNREGAES